MADVKKLAQKILERIKTPEQAIALKGEERAKYLDALDKVFGPKEQRAADMGLTKKVYHGTSEPNIERFKDSTEGYYGRGVYTSDNPEVAAEYGKKLSGKNVMPLRTSENLVDVRTLYQPARSTLPPELQEKLAKATSEKEFNQILAREGGYHGLTAPYKYEHLITDPTKLRSEFAAFDPRFKDSPYLMSAVGGGPLPFQGSANPAQLVEKAYGTYSKGVSDVAKKIADKLHETVSIPGTLTKEQKEEDPSRKVLEFATEMAIDPLNYLGPGEIKALGAVAAGIKGIKKEKAVKDVAEKLIQNAKKATESRKFEPVVSSKWGTVTKDVPLPAKELAESVAPAGSHSGVELATKWEGSREFGKEPLGVSRGQGLAVREGEIESAKDAAARYLQYLQKMKKPKLP